MQRHKKTLLIVHGMEKQGTKIIQHKNQWLAKEVDLEKIQISKRKYFFTQCIIKLKNSLPQKMVRSWLQMQPN